MEKSNTYLFTYGTLQHPYVQEQILGRLIPQEPAVLKDYAINCAAAYYDIVPMSGKSVQGMILPVTKDELDRADLWEDVPLYKRMSAEVETADGTCVSAIVYVKTVPDTSFTELTDMSRLTNYPEDKLRAAVDECAARHNLRPVSSI